MWNQTWFIMNPKTRSFALKQTKKFLFCSSLTDCVFCMLHNERFTKNQSVLLFKKPHPLSFKHEDHDHIVNLLANHPISAATNKPWPTAPNYTNEM